MRRYLSVFEMIVRSSIYKVLLVISSMLIAEMLCFYFCIMNPDGRSIEACIDQSLYSLIFKIAYVLVTIVIVLPGMNLGSIQSYTLKRLRIKENRVFWLQVLYNLGAYILLWGMQLVAILVSILVYLKNTPEGAVITNQTMFLAFYRNTFLHTILPLEDGPGWWMIALVGITSALATAVFTSLQRQGKFGFELLILVIAALIYFPRPLGYDIAFMMIVFCAVYCVMGIRAASKFLGGDES